MKGYLEAEGYANISKFLRPDFCSLDVFQAMMQAGLIWPRELSVLREMMTCIGRNDLAAQLIDKFKTTGLFLCHTKIVHIKWVFV